MTDPDKKNEATDKTNGRHCEAPSEITKKPDPHIPYLSHEEYVQLSKYKHYATKTWYEMFMLNNVTYVVEQKVVPQSWSPNAITSIGHIPYFVTVALTLYHTGVTMHQDLVPGWLLLAAAASNYWFSWFDMMDGQRARRLKCGSPIGRIVDEAGDLMVTTWQALYGGYLMRAEPGLICFSYAFVNMIPYCMEMSFIVTGEFHQHAGEFDIGPVEIEIMLSTLWAYCGVYGYQGIYNPLNQYLPASLASYVPDEILLQHCLAAFFIILQLMFLLDNLVKSFSCNPKLALRLFMSPLVPFAPAFISVYLGTYTYKHQHVLFFLLHNFSFNVQCYRLMISNMTRSIPFNPFGWENVISCLPLLAHLLFPEEAAWYEAQATIVAIVLLVILFYGHIYLLSQQWLAYEKGKRRWWTITLPSDAKSDKKLK